MKEFVGGWLACLHHYRHDIVAMFCILGIIGAMLWSYTHPII